ncbi:MAG: archaetidylserine decarboxylase [Bdellovibrionota bacterium]
MFYSILYVLPKNLVSYLFGLLAQITWPGFVVREVIRGFAKIYKIDLYQAEKEIAEYRSLDDFFTRKLKIGIRPIGKGVVHPADSNLTQYGKLAGETLIQAKGMLYSLKDFLCNDVLAERLFDGYFFLYYLCPTDYHRVHSPVDGFITDIHYIPGKLWPVNNWSTSNIKNLFAINERVVVTIKTDQGVCSLVMVGATNVGKMTLTFDKDIITNKFLDRNPIQKKYDQPIAVLKGDDLGAFHMGSTVVMVYEKNFFPANPNFASGPVRMGESLLKDS